MHHCVLCIFIILKWKWSQIPIMILSQSFHSDLFSSWSVCEVNYVDVCPNGANMPLNSGDQCVCTCTMLMTCTCMVLMCTVLGAVCAGL